MSTKEQWGVIYGEGDCAYIYCLNIMLETFELSVVENSTQKKTRMMTILDSQKKKKDWMRCSYMWLFTDYKSVACYSQKNTDVDMVYTQLLTALISWRWLYGLCTLVASSWLCSVLIVFFFRFSICFGNYLFLVCVQVIFSPRGFMGNFFGWNWPTVCPISFHLPEPGERNSPQFRISSGYTAGSHDKRTDLVFPMNI